MQLIFLLASVLAFSSLMNAQGSPVAHPDIKLGWTAIAFSVLVALAWFIGQLRKQLSDSQMAIWSPWIRRGENLHRGAYLGVIVIVFVVLDFAEIAHSNWRLDGYFLADELAVSLLLAIPLLASWLGFAAATVGEETTCSLRQRLEHVWLQARHLMVLPLVPILVMTGVADLQRLMLPASSEASRGIVGVIAVLVIVFSLPLLLRCCWPTRALEAGPVRDLIEDTLARSGVRVTNILRWETHGQLANAAITGFSPRLRYLFVTDELLGRLTNRDLQAVTAHEAAHCRHGHLSHLATSLAIPFFAMLLADQLLLSLQGTGLPVAPLWGMGMLAAWSLWHRHLAGLLEHQADLAACQLLSQKSGRISDQSVETYQTALQATGASPEGDWLHPAPSVRVDRLRQWATDGRAMASFERRIRRVVCGQRILIGLLATAWVCYV